MLNQTFSLENFEEIYDEDNRRGKNKDNDFFPEVVALSNRLTLKTKALQAFRKRYSSYEKYPKKIQDRYDLLLQNLKKERKKRDVAVTKSLQNTSQKVNQKSFFISIHQNNSLSHPVYQRDDTPEAYYALRQITRNIRNLYKTKPANRNLIVSQIINLLQDNFPYEIIRTDIKSFFESVDQEILVKKLIDDQLL
ncbi:MAG: hypothetical protein AAF549_09370, partial [Pseudomonadota bacterium]